MSCDTTATDQAGLRIMVDTVAANTGGGVSRTRELAGNLPELGPHHRYLFVVQPELRNTIRKLRPELRTVTPPPRLRGTAGRLSWEHLVMPLTVGRSFAPDIVFSPFNIVPRWWPAQGDPKLAVIVSSLAPYAPEVRSLYRGAGAMRLHLLRRWTDRTLERADRVFLLSRQAFALIPPRLLRNAELLPMAPPESPRIAAAPPAQMPAEPFFLMALDIYRYKGVEIVLKALRAIVREKRPIVLLAGSALERGYLATLEQMSAEWDLTSHFHFLGRVEQAELMSLMRHARGCIMPSRFENGGRVPVEAMALGTPVIAADVPWARERCGEGALYFGVDRPEQLADHLQVLAGDTGYREERIAAGRAHISHLDSGSATEQILRSLEALGRD